MIETGQREPFPIAKDSSKQILLWIVGCETYIMMLIILIILTFVLPFFFLLHGSY